MKYYIIYLLPFLSSSVYSGDWVSDTSTGCQVWSWSSNSSEESIRWWGKCLEGKATGKGILQWFLNGKPNGHCQEIEYSEGKRVKGICSSAEGVYEGDFTDDKKTGFAKFTRKNSEISIGFFADGILVRQYFNCSSQVECLENERKENEKREIEEQQEKTRLKQKERERQALLKRESALPPQAMYLQAGKYDRSGQQSDAIRLYELLIEKFPSSPLAVQATNRLVAIQADEKASNSSKPSNTTCSHLYIGKAVSYKGCGALWCTTVEGVITGIGDGVATMRVTGSEYNGDVIEKSCSKF